jgi:HSP20 family molecular chaperone IbpA
MNLNALVPWRNNKSELPARREDFLDPFVTMRREMDRIFDRFFEGFPTRAGESWQAITPAVDIDETNKEMVVTAELPGVTDKDIEVSVAGREGRRAVQGRRPDHPPAETGGHATLRSPHRGGIAIGLDGTAATPRGPRAWSTNMGIHQLDVS